MGSRAFRDESALIRGDSEETLDHPVQETCCAGQRQQKQGENSSNHLTHDRIPSSVGRVVPAMLH